MKKVVLGLAVAALVLSCKKVPEGGNKGVLKKEHGVERYDDHEERAKPKTEETAPVKDSVKVENTQVASEPSAASVNEDAHPH